MTITQWHVPIDDTSCYWYAIFTSFGEPVDHAADARAAAASSTSCPTTARASAARTTTATTSTSRRARPITGMGFDINVHDQWAIESQGRIQDRTREHLGTTDKAIIAYRRLLLPAIEPGGRTASSRRCWLDAARRRAHPRPVDHRRHGARRRLGAATGRSPTPSAAASSSWAAPRARRWRRYDRAMTLVERRGLWTDDRRTATREAERRIEAGELSASCALAFADQHGMLRGKTLVAGEIGARAEERRRLHQRRCC